MNDDGSGIVRLTDHPSFDSFGGWSPDGRTIAFTSEREGNRDIHLIGADGSEVTRLTNSPEGEGSLQWSPDGRQMLFGARIDDSTRGTFLMNADGSGVRLLTDHPTSPMHNRWRVFVKKGVAENNDTYVPTLDDLGEFISEYVDDDDYLIERNSGYDNSVVGFRSWLYAREPMVHNIGVEGDDGVSLWLNGTQVAAQTDAESPMAYGEMHFRRGWNKVEALVYNGPGHIRLRFDRALGELGTVSAAGPSYGPAHLWSPDGRHIAFVSNRDGDCEIYVMRRDGSEIVKLTDNSAEGQLIRYVKGYAAEIEREKIRERTMRGKQARAEKGMLPQGTGRGTYGYTYDPETGKRKIAESEAEVVKRIFDSCVGGTSCHSIALRLNEDNIPAFSGGKWHPRTIKRLLTNSAYKGVTVFGQTRRVPLGGRKYRIVPKEPSEVMEIADATPAIVSSEIWDKAQLILARPRRNPNISKRKYLLTGRLRQ